MIGKEQITINLKSKFFTVEDLVNKLIHELGQSFKDLIINQKTKNINPDILIFVDNREIQTLQKLKTPLSNGNQITFLSSIHGGF